jgi:hypothetical protein
MQKIEPMRVRSPEERAGDKPADEGKKRAPDMEKVDSKAKSLRDDSETKKSPDDSPSPSETKGKARESSGDDDRPPPMKKLRESSPAQETDTTVVKPADKSGGDKDEGPTKSDSPKELEKAAGAEE